MFNIYIEILRFLWSYGKVMTLFRHSIKHNITPAGSGPKLHLSTEKNMWHYPRRTMHGESINVDAAPKRTDSRRLLFL